MEMGKVRWNAFLFIIYLVDAKLVCLITVGIGSAKVVRIIFGIFFWIVRQPWNSVFGRWWSGNGVVMFAIAMLLQFHFCRFFRRMTTYEEEGNIIDEPRIRSPFWICCNFPLCWNHFIDVQSNDKNGIFSNLIPRSVGISNMVFYI